MWNNCNFELLKKLEFQFVEVLALLNDDSKELTSKTKKCDNVNIDGVTHKSNFLSQKVVTRMKPKKLLLNKSSQIQHQSFLRKHQSASVDVHSFFKVVLNLHITLDCFWSKENVIIKIGYKKEVRGQTFLRVRAPVEVMGKKFLRGQTPQSIREIDFESSGSRSGSMFF